MEKEKEKDHLKLQLLLDLKDNVVPITEAVQRMKALLSIPDSPIDLLRAISIGQLPIDRAVELINATEILQSLKSGGEGIDLGQIHAIFSQAARCQESDLDELSLQLKQILGINDAIGELLHSVDRGICNVQSATEALDAADSLLLLHQHPEGSVTYTKKTIKIRNRKYRSLTEIMSQPDPPRSLQVASATSSKDPALPPPTSPQRDNPSSLPATSSRDPALPLPTSPQREYPSSLPATSSRDPALPPPTSPQRDNPSSLLATSSSRHLFPSPTTRRRSSRTGKSTSTDGKAATQ